MAGRQYGFLGPRSGHAGVGDGLFVVPVDVLSTGEKSPVPALFQIGDVILAVFLAVFTAEVTGATKTMDIGFNGSATDRDADGLADNISTAATGLIGTSLVAGAVTRGALMKETVTDSAAATHASPNPYVILNADTVLSYTLASTHTELVADIYLRMWRPPVAFG